LDKAGQTPPSEDPYVEYGVLMANQGETEKSISLLEDGLSKNPRSARANFELGRVLFKAGQLENAERYLHNAATLDPNFSRPHFFWQALPPPETEPIEEGKCTLVFFSKVGWQ
jgi:Flp pilus assembly protein TadD